MGVENNQSSLVHSFYQIYYYPIQRAFFLISHCLLFSFFRISFYFFPLLPYSSQVFMISLWYGAHTNCAFSISRHHHTCVYVVLFVGSLTAAAAAVRCFLQSFTSSMRVSLNLFLYFSVHTFAYIYIVPSFRYRIAIQHAYIIYHVFSFYLYIFLAHIHIKCYFLRSLLLFLNSSTPLTHSRI